MKKFGFTLAEVLITLSIIGVVSAVTLPTLTSNTRTAQIGPKLAKAASMFEQANQALLNENNIDSLRDLRMGAAQAQFVTANQVAYIDTLADFMKIARPLNNPYQNNRITVMATERSICGPLLGMNHDAITYFTSNDGILYGLRINNAAGAGTRPHRISVGQLYVDVNGSSRPNVIGRDIFAFLMYADGSLRPVGADNWNDGVDSCHWSGVCDIGADPTSGYGCTGHIFANDLKVLYR